MTEKLRFSVVRLRAQKDQFSVAGDVQSDSVFAASEKVEGEIVRLKRTVIEGKCGKGEKDSDWRVIVSHRSGLVTVTVSDPTVISSRDFSATLAEKIANYSLDHDWRARLGFNRIETHGENRTICATTDAAKLVDIFHHLHDFGWTDLQIP